MKGATVVDLDGSLISGNSMHIFMKRLPGLLMKRRSPGAAIGALWWTWLRSLHIVSHSNMKWHLTKTARRHLQEEDWENMAATIAESINPRVSDLIDSRRKLGCLTYIATAALEEYALPLSRILGYEGAVATKFSDDQETYEEMKGHTKHAGIEQLLSQENLRLESFITDHPDDLPTAKAYPFLTILVNPTQKIADQFHEIGVTRYIS